MSQSKKHLLIIEDDPGLQKQLRWSLDDYDVLVAGDREAALAMVRRHEPAVITMDLGLPPDPDGATEGFATLQQILSLTPDAKVIVLTGNQDRANAVKAIGLGAYDFHHKPFESTKSAGMGIGVFESREYIHELGGRLEVASRPSLGTTFKVILPLYRQDALLVERAA